MWELGPKWVEKKVELDQLGMVHLIKCSPLPPTDHTIGPVMSICESRACESLYATRLAQLELFKLSM